MHEDEKSTCYKDTKILYLLTFNSKLEASWRHTLNARKQLEKQAVFIDISLYTGFKNITHIRCIGKIFHKVEEPLKCRLETAEIFDLEELHKVCVLLPKQNTHVAAPIFMVQSSAELNEKNVSIRSKAWK